MRPVDVGHPAAADAVDDGVALEKVEALGQLRGVAGRHCQPSWYDNRPEPHDFGGQEPAAGRRGGSRRACAGRSCARPRGRGPGVGAALAGVADVAHVGVAAAEVAGEIAVAAPRRGPRWRLRGVLASEHVGEADHDAGEVRAAVAVEVDGAVPACGRARGARRSRAGSRARTRRWTGWRASRTPRARCRACPRAGGTPGPRWPRRRSACPRIIATRRSCSATRPEGLPRCTNP